MIGVWKHLLDRLYKVPIMVWPYLTIWREKGVVSELVSESGFPTLLKISKFDIWIENIALKYFGIERPHLNIFPSYSYESRISKSEKSFMHNLLVFFELIFKLISLIKSLRKKFHFFEIHISTSIFQVCFECALAIPKHFRTIFST